MLLHVSGSLMAIAKAIGVKSPQTVLKWRNGVATPHPEVRAQMQIVLGIPIQAWTHRPAEQQQGDEEQRDEQPPQSSLDECLDLLHVIRRDRSQPNLLPGERSKLVDAEARILKLRSDLELRAELSEDRYVREHPAWLRIRNELARALVPFPDAARAVADALERLNA
jgi:transcriptional regulator with XRE-family HTH domain